jgi:hypothetical protein
MNRSCFSLSERARRLTGALGLLLGLTALPLAAQQ